MNNIIVNSFIFESGERYCHVIYENNGEPLYDPNLYITTQVRNRSCSINTMEAVAGSLALLYRFFSIQKIHIKERINRMDFLKINEIDALVDFTSKNFKNKKTKYLHEVNYVKGPTQYFRLTVICDYLEWLCKVHLYNSYNKETRSNVEVFINDLKMKRPANADRYKNQLPDKALSKEQIGCLFSIIKVGSDLNPFSNQVQKRNRLIVLLIFSLGLRAGELLNLRVSDIDFPNLTIAIKRRHDDKTDKRVNQPLVKTCERVFRVDELFMSELFDYIVSDRKNIKKSKGNEFLFVTYKKGYSQGDGLSFSAYHKIIDTISKQSPALMELTGHKLRHTWNYEFSAKLDSMKKRFSEEKEEQIRSYLMGWRPGTETAKIYIQRHIIEQSHKTSLAFQNDLMRELRDE